MTMNINAKKRLTQIIIAAVILCMAVTGSVFLLKDSIKDASATTYNVNVSSAAEWNSALNGKYSGDVVNITLTNSIAITGIDTASATLTAVPSGVTVNLNMNNKSITWDTEGSGGDYWKIMSTSYPLADTYWGLIKNNGTLSITGTGTIRQKKVCYNQKNGSKQDNYGSKGCAILNKGTLTVGSSVTVESYVGMAHNDASGFPTDNRFTDQFIYSCGIYNEGTVNSSGTINSGTFSGSVSTPGTNSYHYGISYGIYGGIVNVRGGKISSVAHADMMFVRGSAKEANQVVAIGIGVYSNTAKITGNTTIETETFTGDSDKDGYTAWQSNGLDVSYSAGVMYTGVNYPVIGAGVNIESKFICAGDGDKIQMTIPGTSLHYSCNNPKAPTDYARRAYPVVGVAQNSNTIGLHSSEKNWSADQGYFGYNSSVMTTDNNVERVFGYSSAKYLAEDPYYDGLSGSSNLVNCENIYRQQSGQNTRETVVAKIANGVPTAGENGSLKSGISNSAVAGGSQYVIVYRYYDNVNTSANLSSVSYKWDSTKQNEAAYPVIGGVPAYNGCLPGGATLNSIRGGTSKNAYYYELANITYERVATASYVARSMTGTIDQLRNWWGTTGNTIPSSGITPTATQTIVIYVNYILKQPTAVRVAVANKGVEINQYTETTDFTTTYTGAPLVPGTDFNIGILDMGAQTELSLNEVEDDTVVTNVYNIQGNGAGSGNNSTAVTYRYTEGKNPGANASWTEGLPKDAGQYTIEVKVNADTTFASTGTYNRLGTTTYITCTIEKTDVRVTGSSARNGVYGNNLATLVPFSEYTAVGAGNESVSGSWSFSQGYKTEDYVDAGNYNLELVWTPTPDSNSAKNYNSTVYGVTLVVNKRPVIVNIGDSKVGYGDESVKYTLSFSNLAACDNGKIDAWERATTGEIQYNGEWTPYVSGVPMGTYLARIVAFGGASDKNNTFTCNTNPSTNAAQYGTLEVGKRILYYTATTTDRYYIPGNSNVEVKLAYKSGAVEGDTVPAEITNVTGVMANPNAGDGKNVYIDVDAIDSPIGNNYQIVIDNATSLVVNIWKATPAGVSCKPGSASIVYDSTRKLSSIGLVKVNVNVPGNWSWKDGDIVPSCDVPSYTAVFTPDDTTNYNTLEQTVNIAVSKKEVIITVPAQTLVYGSSQPALVGLLTYTGFTGEDSRANVQTTGEVTVSTDYTRGLATGTYTITVRSTLESTNYKFTAQNSTITVVKKALTIAAIDQSVTYGQAKPVLDENDVVATGFYGNDSLTSGALAGTLSVTTAYERGSNAGEYAINVSGVTATNYDISFVSGVLTVDKATLTVRPTAQTITYGATTPEYLNNKYYTVTGFVANDTAASVVITGAPSFSTQYVQGSSVGSYTVTPNVSGMSTTNYNFTYETELLVVEKATPVVTGSPTGSVTHGQTYADVTVTPPTVINPNDSSVTVPGRFVATDSTKVADYTENWGADLNAAFTFIPDDDINYNTASASGMITINQKAVTGKPIIRGSVMQGQTLTVDLSALDPTDASKYTFQWYVDDVAVAGATNTTYTIAASDLNKNIHVVATAKSGSGYTGSATSDKTSAVIMALTPAGEFALDITIPGDSTYDCTVKSATVTVKSDYENRIGTVTVKYNGSTQAPKNAGTYIITVDIDAPVVAGNAYDPSVHYGPVSGLEIGRFTIAKAPINVTVDAQNKTYDGSRTAQATITEEGKLGSDDVKVAAGYTFQFDSVNAGERNIIVNNLALTGADAANYTAVVLPATAYINPATLTARAMGVTKIYDGSTVVDVKFTNIEGYKGGDSDTTVYVTDGKAYAEKADVGTGIHLSNITYTLRGSSSGNYVLNITNTPTVDITPATPAVIPPTITGLVYDSARTLLNIDLTPYSTSTGSWRFDDTTIVPTVNVKRYAATFYPSTGNYSTVKAYITINVSPKTVVITAEDKVVEYGKTSPSFTYIADGLTGLDTLNDIPGAGVSATTSYYVGQPVGEYDILLDAHFDSDNYSFTTQSGKLVVTPAKLTVKATAVDKIYNGNTEVTVNFAIVSGKYGTDSIGLTFTQTTGVSATANAGLTTVSYNAPELVGEKASNYELVVTPATTVLTVNILKADVQGVVFPADGEVQFGYDLTNAKFATAGVGNGTFAYENAKGTIPSAVGVYSNYKVIFTPTDSRNYNTQEAYVTLTVVKCRLDYVVGIAGTPQEGQKLTAHITGMPSLANDYILYQWYRVSVDGYATKIEGAQEATYTAAKEDIGNTLVVVTYFQSDAPYVFADSADVILVEEGVEGITGRTSTTIEALKLTFWQKLMNWIYRLIAAISGIRISGFGK